MPSKEGSDAMQMRRAIGISLACLVTSACATGTPSEESKSNDPGEATGIPQQKAEMAADKSRSSPCGTAQERPSADYCSGLVEQRFAGFELRAAGYGTIPVPCCYPVRAVGKSQFGKAAWYNHVGRPTASGEMLDTVTATAAHRTLPLASFAQVTNLDNGRSVVVKINDRGPFTRGRILDLSPRAADVLDMKAAGVVAVVVEPLADEMAGTTVAMF
jgi:rare lipoprotein A